MPNATRRLGPILLAGLLLVVIAGPVTAGSTGLPGTPAASAPLSGGVTATSPSGLLNRTNARRTSRGLVVLRNDSDLASIARARAAVMAQNNVMSHTEPDGTTVFDRIRNAGFTWYAAGEVIGWNTYSTQASSVKAVIDAWMASSSHRAILVSSGYNYVGFGMAVSSSGRRYFAGVFAKEPDETGARTHLHNLTKQRVSTTSVRVRLDWSGTDPRLQVLTSGLAKFEVQRRKIGGTWKTWGTTTATSKAVTWSTAHDHQFRVRARDKRGNWGAWKVIRVNL